MQLYVINIWNFQKQKTINLVKDQFQQATNMKLQRQTIGHRIGFLIIKHGMTTFRTRTGTHPGSGLYLTQLSQVQTLQNFLQLTFRYYLPCSQDGFRLDIRKIDEAGLTKERKAREIYDCNNSIQMRLDVGPKVYAQDQVLLASSCNNALQHLTLLLMWPWLSPNCHHILQLRLQKRQLLFPLISLLISASRWPGLGHVLIFKIVAENRKQGDSIQSDLGH